MDSCSILKVSILLMMLVNVQFEAIFFFWILPLVIDLIIVILLFQVTGEASDLFNLPSVRFLHESSMYSIEKYLSQFLFAKWIIWSVKSPATESLKNKRSVYVDDGGNLQILGSMMVDYSVYHQFCESNLCCHNIHQLLSKMIRLKS